MKVLMISADANIFKKGSEAQERMEEYGKLAAKLDIIVFSGKGFKKTVISDNTTAYPTNSEGKFFYLFDALKIVKQFKGQGINLVTAQDPFEAGFLGWRAARLLKAKLQLQIHTDFLSPYFLKESLKNRIRVMAAKWLLPKADGIRVVSERIKRGLSVMGKRLSEIVVLPIFVDAEKVQKETVKIDLHQKYPQFDFVVLMTLRLEREKNIGLAIEAMNEVAPNYPKAGLVIVGEGSFKNKLQSQVESLELENNIVFAGWADDLAPYYKTADAYLLTSNYEGYGRTLISAASAGLPIITTDVGLAGGIINKDNSLVVPVGDKKAIVESIVKLMSEDNLRRNLGERARKSVETLGSKESYLREYKKSWEMCL